MCLGATLKTAVREGREIGNEIRIMLRYFGNCSAYKPRFVV